MRRFAPLLLVSVAMLCLALFVGPGKTIYVDDDASCWLQNGTKRYPFATIQDAIDVAGEGATVNIAVGYYAPFVMTKALHLRGAGIDNVRIVGETGAPCLVMTEGLSILEGLSFLGPGRLGEPEGVGLRIENAAHVLVLSCKLPYFQTGIEIENSEVTLAATIIEESRTGAWVDEDSVLHASANMIVNNDVGVDCDAGEVESWDDLLAGNGLDIAASCLLL